MATRTKTTSTVEQRSPADMAEDLLSKVLAREFLPSHNGLPRTSAVNEIETMLEDLDDQQRATFHHTLVQFLALTRDELPVLVTAVNQAIRRLPGRPRQATAEEKRNAAAWTMSPAEIEEREALERGVGRW